MTKIFKQLARHWAACLAVAALLIVQAYCDLSLPDYTSKIVDVGIQQGGIESPVPYTVRDTTLQALELLMTEDEAALAAQWYSEPAQSSAPNILPGNAIKLPIPRRFRIKLAQNATPTP